VKDVLRRVTRPLGIEVSRYREAPPDFLPADVELLRLVRPYTMTSPERVYAAVQAARYVADAKVPGAVVECGVWRGGSMLAMARALLERGAGDRDLYLYDTFEGMPAPTPADRDLHGRSAAVTFAATRSGEDRAAWCDASLADVQATMARSGYDPARVHYVQGKVEDTLPGGDGVEPAPDRIALLRLDTDWYTSTKLELEHLYPRLSSGGVLIIDDYGHWQGARQAVDEYLAENGLSLLLQRVDYSARLVVKP